MISSWLISAFVTSFCALGMLWQSSELMHWFVIPVVASGAIIGIDAVDWLRGRLPFFDPAGILGLLGFHVFFVCPLLVGGWNHGLRYLPDQPDDYRPWLGVLGSLTFVGLMIYRGAARAVDRRLSNRLAASRTQWRISPRHFWLFLLMGLILTASLQAYAYYMLGGIQGYVSEYSAWLRGHEAFRGTAGFFAVSESFPILAIFGYAIWSKARPWRRSWPALGVILIAFTVLLLLFGGLRGSRSNTVWGIVWAVGIIHLWIRPVPRIMVICGLPLLVGFMSAYAVYKAKGADTLEFLANATSYAEVANGTETTTEILTGDLGRSDVQAFLLYRLLSSSVPYDYAIGQTYLGALALLIPKDFWNNRPPTKVKWTTEAEYGVGSFDNAKLLSTRVYGLLGETMLNFGPLLVPLAFLWLGCAIAVIRRAILTLQPGDSRLLMAPFLVIFCIQLLINDSDNQVFFLAKYGLIPFLLVLFASQRQSRGTNCHEYQLLHYRQAHSSTF